MRAAWIKAMDPKMDDSEIGRVIARAREEGLSGFGGGCGEAAVALNRAVFGGRGVLVGAFNEAFLDHEHLLGHVAVLVDGAYWDSDGRPKPFDEIESWGMLDPEDVDYQEQAKAHGIEWTDDAAETVASVEFDDEAEILERFGSENLEGFLAAIERAKAALGLDLPTVAPVAGPRP
jgi:hypothetical protein